MSMKGKGVKERKGGKRERTEKEKKRKGGEEKKSEWNKKSGLQERERGGGGGIYIYIYIYSVQERFTYSFFHPSFSSIEKIHQY